MLYGRRKGVPEWLRFDLVKAVCAGHVPYPFIHSSPNSNIRNFVELETMERVAKTLLSNKPRAQNVTSSQLIWASRFDWRNNAIDLNRANSGLAIDFLEAAYSISYYVINEVKKRGKHTR